MTELRMKAASIAVFAMICMGWLALPARAQDPGTPDTVILVSTVTPDFTTGTNQLAVELWVYSDEALIGATAGFNWDNGNFQMDSAKASPLTDNNFEIGPFFYENNSRAVTNANLRFLFGGSVLSGNGVPADASGRRLWATYYFTTSSWEACDQVEFDSLTFSSGSQYLFVTDGNATFVPGFGGSVTVTDTACAPPANLVLDPTALTFSTYETGPNPANQMFNVNSDGDPVDFTSSESIPWLSASPSSGNTPQAITVSIDNSGLTEGQYVDSIMVSSTMAPNSPQYEVVTVNVGPPPNVPPELGSVTDQETTEGVDLNFDVTATDANGTTPLLSSSALPGTASFTDHGDGSGTFDWTPGFFDSGVYDVTFYATDAIDAGLIDSAEIQITVLDSNRVPVVTYDMGQNTDVDEGGTLQLVVTGNDPDLTTPSLSAHLDGSTSLAPNMAFVDSGNGAGVLTFMPDFTQGNDDPTRYDVVFEAADETDPALTDATAPVVISVFNVNQAPTVTPVTDRSVCANGSLSVPVSASDPDGDPLEMWIDPLVTNMSFDYAGGNSGTIRFDPSDAQVDVYPTSVYASDGTDTAFTTFAITVVDCAATDTGRIVLYPRLLHWYYQNGFTEQFADAYVGDFIGGHSADQIGPATVRVDGDIVPSEVLVLDSYSDFTGPVLKVSYSMKLYLEKQGPFMDTVFTTLRVSGEFDDAGVFTVGGAMTLVGHRSGDVNLDGDVNISDVTTMVADMFMGQAAPMMEAGDVDGNCGVTISDIIYLVRNLFAGGPALHSTCTPY